MVSGQFDAETPFRRSPCLGVNTLANHGYINRDGKNITRAQLKQAVMLYYNAEDTAAETFLGPLPDVFDLNSSLATTSKSTTRRSFTLTCTSVKTQLRLTVLGELRMDRLATCLAHNPNCTSGDHQVFLAFGEAALVWHVTTQTVDKHTLRSFFEYERFPDNFKHPEVLALNDVIDAVGKITAVPTQVSA